MRIARIFLLTRIDRPGLTIFGCSGFLAIGRALKTAITAVMAAGLLAACAGGGAMKKPVIDVTEVRIANFDRESAQLTVLLRVQNPNNIELNLTDINAKLFLSDQEVAQAEATQPKFTLPAMGSMTLPMRVTVPFKTLPEALKKSTVAMVSGGLPYKLSGSVTTFNGLLTVPFEKTGEIAKRR